MAPLALLSFHELPHEAATPASPHLRHSSSSRLPTVSKPPAQPAGKFDLQVAGHGGIVRSGADVLLKPACAKERSFYDMLATNPTEHAWLRQFIPAYYGVFHGASDFLRLQDLTAPLARPCVLDVKLGARQWDDDATPEKIARLAARAAATTSAQTGVRLAGMRRETPDGDVRTVTRATTNGFTRADLEPALRWFVHDGTQVRKSVARRVAQRIRLLVAAVETQTDFMFYGTSLLVLFDGAGSESDGEAVVDVRLIDFAHTVPAHGKTDENILFGLRNLLNLFESVSENEGPSHLPTSS